MIPNRGYKTKGTREVAARGTASVIHQIAMSTAIAAMRPDDRVFSLQPSETGQQQEREDPNQNPIFCETGDRFEVRTFSPMVAILSDGTGAGKLLEGEIPVFQKKCRSKSVR